MQFFRRWLVFLWLAGFACAVPAVAGKRVPPEPWSIRQVPHRGGDPNRPLVAMLHGIAGTHWNFKHLQQKVADLGFPNWSITYPWRTGTRSSLSQGVAERLRDVVPSAGYVLINYSLGGLLDLPLQVEGRVGTIDIGVPRKGCDVVRKAAGSGWLSDYFNVHYGPIFRDVARMERQRPPEGRYAVAVGHNPRWLSKLGIMARYYYPRGKPRWDGMIGVDETDFDAFDPWHRAFPLNHRDIIKDKSVHDFVVAIVNTWSPQSARAPVVAH